MNFDLIVIGAGPGGHAAALEASRAGASVVIVDRGSWGGTCTHWGCIPAKAFLASSGKLAELKKLKRLGIKVDNPSLDFSVMKRHQQQMIRVSALGVRKSLEESGVEIREGEGTILAPGEVEIVTADGAQDLLKARNIVIAWGSEAVMLPGIEKSDRILDSKDVLAMNTLPSSIIIVGGGAIGVEFATFMAECGVNVTIVELMDQILPYEEQEAAVFLTNELGKLGITVHTSTKMESLTENDGAVHLKVQSEEGVMELDADYALICVGRKPLLRTDELDRLSLRYDKKGISVDHQLMTNIENIYAVGDVTGGILLAHRAMAQGHAVANNLFGDRSISYSDEFIPIVAYTHPTVARVGLTERTARERGLDIEIRRVEYGVNIMARTELMGPGFVKAIFSNDRIVGVTIAGDEASELIAPMSLAVAHQMGIKELKSWVIPHPSLSELLNSW
ncbi:MAG: dihydrolipoyl dehydrogenase [Deltaproteobacteria bacterium]|nr:dihydrolipoyl dehydrogenase [Deltaproteobacteria bacterium]